MGTIMWFAAPSPLVWWQLALYMCAVGWGSFVIGCFGVGGGAIFVPLMLMLPGVEAPLAVGTVFIGVVLMSWARSTQLYFYGHLNIRGASIMMIGAVVGALLGQVLLPLSPEVALAYLVSFLAILAGVQTQRKMAREYRMHRQRQAEVASAQASPSSALPAESQEPRQDRKPSEMVAAEVEGNAAAAAAPAAKSAGGAGGAGGVGARGFGFLGEGPKAIAKQIGIGFLAAFLSSLSGTGGPLIFFPLMMLIDPDLPMKSLVGISSPLSLCLVNFSAIGALVFGEVDLGIALVFTVVSAIFTLLGGMMMERLGDSCLKLTVGVVLIGIGTSVAIRTTVGLITDEA